MKYRTSSMLVWSPFAVAVISAYHRSFWLVMTTVILMFVVVGVLPVTRKRENLWLFVLCALCGIPINLFLIREYPVWEIMTAGSENRVFRLLAMMEVFLIYTSIEEVIVALVGRRIWKRQYALALPEFEE